jgi:hypothetical protein
MKQKWWRETVAYVIGFVIVLVVLYFIVMVGAYALAFVGVGIVMSLDFAAHGFRWLGVSDPAVGWLLLGVLMGGSMGLAQGLKRSGRQADTIKVYIGAAALACTLPFLSFLAVSPPASRALTVPAPAARPPTRETPSPTSAPPTGVRSGAVSLPSPATLQTLRHSSGIESAPTAVTVELSSPTPGVTFQPKQRFQEIPGKQVKITASKKGYVTAEKTILVADHDMSEVLGPLPRQAELEQGELERRKRQAEDTERRRREAKQAEQQQRENILIAQGMKFIVKRQFLCLNTQDNLVVGTTTLTGASSLSCEDAGRALMAEYEKKKDCASPSQKEGQKQWIGTASCPAP